MNRSCFFAFVFAPERKPRNRGLFTRLCGGFGFIRRLFLRSGRGILTRRFCLICGNFLAMNRRLCFLCFVPKKYPCDCTPAQKQNANDHENKEPIRARCSALGDNNRWWGKASL